MLKNLLTLFLYFLLIQMGFAQTEIFYVKPITTDINYSPLEDSNYVVRNTTIHLNKLVLFLGGSFSSPDDYSLFCRYAATRGFDVISLSYPNDVATAPLGTSSDSLVFDKYRQEVCFGTPVSGSVSLDTLNSIYTRTLKLIQYLAISNSQQNWGQYLATPTALDWSKILVGGHSQGSGHACYLSKSKAVERVLLFSGPNDFSTFYNKPAHWLSLPGVSQPGKYFALLHLQDEIVPFSHQFSNLTALGMAVSDDSTLIDNLVSPYNNSHLLYTTIPAFSNHSAPVGGNPILPSVWNYMLSTPLTTSKNDLTSNLGALKIYPNPTKANLTLEIPLNYLSDYFYIFNSIGHPVVKESIDKNPSKLIDVTNFQNGIYFIIIGGMKVKFLKY